MVRPDSSESRPSAYHWSTLKGPVALAVAVAAACGIGFALALSKSTIPYNTAWTVITIGVVVDMSQTERMLVKSILRGIGTLFGAALGLGILSVNAAIDPTGTGTMLTANLWLWIAISMTVFLSSVLMLFAGDNSYAFHLCSITVVIVSYSGSIIQGVVRFLSVLLGIVLSVLAVLLVSHERTHHALLLFYRQVADKGIDMIIASLICWDKPEIESASSQASPKTGEPCAALLETIRTSLFSAEEALIARKKLRRWTRMAPEPFLDDLSVAVVNLYHECHNLFVTSSNIGVPEHTEFSRVFGPDLKALLMGFREFKMSLLGEGSRGPGEIGQMQVECSSYTPIPVISLSHLLSNWARIVQVYGTHRTGFLAERTLRWQLNAINISLAGVLHAIASYLEAVYKVEGNKRSKGQNLEISVRLGQIKSELEQFLRSGPVVE